MKIIGYIEDKIEDLVLEKNYEEELLWFGEEGEKDGSQETSFLIIWLKTKFLFLYVCLIILYKLKKVYDILFDLLSIRIKDIYFAVERDTPANKLSSNKFNLRNLNEPNQTTIDGKLYCRRYRVVLYILIETKSYSFNKRIGRVIVKSLRK